MTDQQHEFTVVVRVRYALWPGDGVLAVKITPAELGSDEWWLVNREGRHHELRPYVVGRQR